MVDLSHNYLSERAVKGIAHYKYKASGYTWLDDLHNPLWNWAVENMLPMWLAPNLVTLTGLMFIIAATVLMTIFAPQVNGTDAPAWVHIFGGFAIIAYVNLDCMDGKQARRTGSSSPLGQLFDHGCDALSVGLILFNVASSVGLECGPLLIGMAYVPMTTWMLAQWEEYHTGAQPPAPTPRSHPFCALLCILLHGVTDRTPAQRDCSASQTPCMPCYGNAYIASHACKSRLLRLSKSV